jgi:hypothetical protein
MKQKERGINKYEKIIGSFIIGKKPNEPTGEEQEENVDHQQEELGG